MTKIIVLTIAVFFTGFLQAQQLNSKEQKEIQKTISAMFQALSDRDSIALKSYCAPDITFYEYGQVWNMDTLIRKAITMNQSADFSRTNSFEFITVRSDKHTAWATYRLHSVITRDGSKTDIQWLETVVLEKPGKRWMVKHLHSTLVKRG